MAEVKEESSFMWSEHLASDSGTEIARKISSYNLIDAAAIGTRAVVKRKGTMDHPLSLSSSTTFVRLKNWLVSRGCTSKYFFSSLFGYWKIYDAKNQDIPIVSKALMTSFRSFMTLAFSSYIVLRSLDYNSYSF